MHTAIVIVGGLVLLGLFLLGGLQLGDMGRAALWFIPVWFCGGLINLWVGVSRAGYSVAEEAPIFVVIFLVPAAIALFTWWKFSTTR